MSWCFQLANDIQNQNFKISANEDTKETVCLDFPSFFLSKLSVRCADCVRLLGKQSPEDAANFFSCVFDEISSTKENTSEISRGEGKAMKKNFVVFLLSSQIGPTSTRLQGALLRSRAVVVCFCQFLMTWLLATHNFEH